MKKSPPIGGNPHHTRGLIGEPSPDLLLRTCSGANGVCQIKASPGTEAEGQDQDIAEPHKHYHSKRVDTASMPAFCRGEASAEFGRRPTEITTNMAFKSGDLYVVQGNYPDGKSSTFFNCWFDGDGNFVSVN